MSWRYGPNRTLCTVLDEMRTCIKTLNFSYLESLIEEAQSMGNRMESALDDKYDIKDYTEERSKLIKEIKKLKKEKQDIE